MTNERSKELSNIIEKCLKMNKKELTRMEKIEILDQLAAVGFEYLEDINESLHLLMV